VPQHRSPHSICAPHQVQEEFTQALFCLYFWQIESKLPAFAARHLVAIGFLLKMRAESIDFP
jgi:hypothetical protein